MRSTALRTAIHDKEFSPAYYLHGEDDYLKDDALRKLIDAAVDAATRDFNLDQRKGGDLDAESLASLLAMPPMMAERRVVVVRDVAALRRDARAVLEKYLASPSTDLLLVLTDAAEAKPDKLLVQRAVATDFRPLTGAQLPKWIVAQVERHFGTTITPDAVDLLQDAVGSDLSQLAIELDKLVSYCVGRPIDEDAVSAVVGVRRDETLGRLLDVVAQKDLGLALQLVPGVLQQPKTTAVSVVMALTTQTLALAIGAARRIPPAKQYTEYFSLLRAGSSNVTGRAWGEAVSTWSRAGARWTAEELDRALDALLQADIALKGSRVSSEEQVLSTALLTMLGARRREAA